MLDPLTYGAAAPPPGPRVDRRLTLVLDRGADLRGLLPRYAHTVNGAADPDIPVQLVRRGEVVEMTVVNRSPRAVIAPSVTSICGLVSSWPSARSQARRLARS